MYSSIISFPNDLSCNNTRTSNINHVYKIDELFLKLLHDKNVNWESSSHHYPSLGTQDFLIYRLHAKTPFQSFINSILITT